MSKQGPCSTPQRPARDLGDTRRERRQASTQVPRQDSEQPAVAKRGLTGSLQSLQSPEAPWDKRGCLGPGPAVPRSVEGRVCGSLLVRQGVQVGTVHSGEDNTNTVSSPKRQFWLLPGGGAAGGKPGRALVGKGPVHGVPWCQCLS